MVMNRLGIVAIAGSGAVIAGVGIACGTFSEQADVEDAGAEAAASGDVVVTPIADAGDSSDGAHVDAGACACPGRPPCGVKIIAAKGAFCIDPTEVTAGAFQEFVNANVGTTIDAGGAPCSAVAIGSRPPPPSPGLPVRNVTFCEARAYCAWAGKHLCGLITGGPMTNTENGDPEQSEWLKACAGDGTQPILSGTCRRNNEDGGPLPSGTTCEGAFPGVFDLQGNVWEWTDSPQPKDDAGKIGAFFMGGAFESPDSYRCTTSGSYITTSEKNIGFRCCSP